MRACVLVGFCAAVSRGGGFAHIIWRLLLSWRFVAFGVGLLRPCCFVYRSYGVVRLCVLTYLLRRRRHCWRVNVCLRVRSGGVGDAGYLVADGSCRRLLWGPVYDGRAGAITIR